MVATQKRAASWRVVSFDSFRVCASLHVEKNADYFMGRIGGHESSTISIFPLD
jgi:hypothetical protein